MYSLYCLWRLIISIDIATPMPVSVCNLRPTTESCIRFLRNRSHPLFVTASVQCLPHQSVNQYRRWNSMWSWFISTTEFHSHAHAREFLGATQLFTRFLSKMHNRIQIISILLQVRYVHSGCFCYLSFLSFPRRRHTCWHAFDSPELPMVMCSRFHFDKRTYVNAAEYKFRL